MKFSFDDTIAAISTPFGRGGIGIVRLSGTKSLEIAEIIFKSSFHPNLKDLPTHTTHHGWIKYKDKMLDEVMLTVLKNPHSFTGEDTIEISAHGGPVVLSEILKICVDKGARLAEKGEFTFRAFVNGKIDLSKAEAVADLINSKSVRSAEMSANQLSGNLSKKIASWKSKLLELVSKVEAALDHSDENLNFVSREDIQKALVSLSAELEILIQSAGKGKFLREGIKISIIGKPNSGKSTLLNALLQRDRAIVTDIPGTTRDILEETLEINGIPVLITDTAGIREHSLDPVEIIGQEKTKEAMLSSDIILWLFDSSVGVSEEDKQIADLIKIHSLSEKTVFILNKIDLPLKISLKEMSGLIHSNKHPVKISAKDEKGLDALEKAVAGFVEMNKTEGLSPVLITERHIEVFNRVFALINEGIESVNKNESEEFIAFHIRGALNTLGEITGETATEEILDQIFSKFCIGK